MAERRRTFGPVVLLGLAAGALAAVSAGKPSVSAEEGSASPLVSYDAHLPLVSALALVVLACWGVVLVTRGRVRRAVALLAVVSGAGSAVAAVAGYVQAPDRMREELAQVGIADPTLSHTAWWWAALLGAVLATGAAVLAVAWAPSWPEMGSRYDAPTAPGTTVPPETPVEEQTSLDLWKAIDEGQDPTA